jgi:hypothetical protein
VWTAFKSPSIRHLGSSAHLPSQDKRAGAVSDYIPLVSLSQHSGDVRRLVPVGTTAPGASCLSTMSTITTFLSSVFERSKLGATGNVELPSVEDEPLVASASQNGTPGRCELRIEGMTCGACVEVSPAFGRLYDVFISIVARSQLKGHSGRNLACTLSK